MNTTQQSREDLERDAFMLTHQKPDDLRPIPPEGATLGWSD